MVLSHSGSGYMWTSQISTPIRSNQAKQRIAAGLYGRLWASLFAMYITAMEHLENNFLFL